MRRLMVAIAVAVASALILGVTLVGAAAPTVTVEDATEVKYTTAHVSGTVDAQGQFTYFHFDYISEAAYQQNLANSAPAFEGAGTGYGDYTEATGAVSGEMTGMQPGTVYHLRLGAENGDGSNEAVASGTFETLDVDAPGASIDPVSTFSATTAHFSGTVDPNAPSGSLDQATKDAYKTRWDFQCTPECPNLKGGFVEAEEGSKAVTADATGLEPNTDYEVKLVVSNASGPQSSSTQSFHTNEAGPGVETLPAFALGNGSEAQVGGWVNPKNSATTYWIEYGTTTSYGQSIPASKDASAGSGPKGQIFTQTISGLQPSTEYHARLVAENAAGETEGHDVNFETAPGGPAPAESCANETLRRENNSTELPDCRAYEQVSPVDKNGFDAARAAEFGNGLNVYNVAKDGSAIAYETVGGFSDTESAPLFTVYRSQRGGNGWATHGLLPPLRPKLGANVGANFTSFSPDTRYGFMTQATPGSLAPGDKPDAVNSYLRDNLTGTWHTLSLESSIGEPGSDPSTPPVIFGFAARPLTPDALPGSNVYEWDDGHIELISIDQNGDPIESAGLNRWVRTSAGIVTVMQQGNGDVFLRKANGQVVKITESRRTPPDPSTPGLVKCCEISADGTKVDFVALPLTNDAQASGVGLYQYDATTNTLTDLTAGALGRELVYSLAAASEDGSYVYFRADSQFHPDENENAETSFGHSGFYVWHNDTIKFIGTDTGDPFYRTEANANTYRASPNGRYLSFSSNARLTSYDNTDSTLDGDGNSRQDEEVYVYDNELERLTCVSCNPSGQRPTGTPGGLDGGSATPTASGERTANIRVPGARDDGAIFFTSRDALVPEDVNGKQDVYEWRDGRLRLISTGTDGRPSVFSGSSVNGDDVFIVTGSQLVSSDQDGLYDVYDAKVDGGFSAPPSPSSCEGTEGCHGPAANAPSLASPASGSLSTSGQPSPSAERLKAARKACNRKPKKSRAKCRARAKKRFTKAGRAH